MGLLGKIGGKIGDKINEKIDETLNPKVSSTNRSSNWKEEYSEKQSRKHGKEISKLEQQMEEFYQNDSNDDLIETCLKIRQIDPFHIDARKLSVYAWKELENYKTAYEDCSKLLQEYPNNSFLTEEMGLILFRSGKFVESIPLFESLIQRIPIDEPLALESKINKAFALYNSRNFDEAIEFCTDQLRLHENNEKLLNVKNEALGEIEKEQTKIKEEKEQQTIQEQRTIQEQVSSKTNSDFSVADELSKFNKLKDQGAISEEEFLEMKKKLLDKI
jgi:tetratricopeptide (TPR) repeat protein